jgi:hypothetical protein
MTSAAEMAMHTAVKNIKRNSDAVYKYLGNLTDFISFGYEKAKKRT